MKTMKVGSKVKLNKKVGTVLAIDGSLGLVKFSFGTFCINLNGK